MFSNANPPKRAGDYSRWLVQRASTLPVSTGGTILLLTVDDWGPLRTPTSVPSFQDYLSKFGQPIDPAVPSPGFIAAYNSFKGEGAEAPGAGEVIVYRMGSSAAQKASRPLGAGATADALTLTAKYEGVRGNNIRAEVVPNSLNPATAMDINLYDGTVLSESYRNYTSAQITMAQDDINRLSALVDASGAVNGTKLDALAAANLTGGNSGMALTAADWTATMNAVSSLRFGILAPYDLTDQSILASLETWAKGLNHAEKSKRFFLVEGGATGEDLSAAGTRAARINDENVLSWGIGTYRDTALGLNLSTSQLAPRLAGIASRRAGMSSMTFAQLDDLEIVQGPSEQDILASLDQGFMVATLGVAGVQFEAGRTTYTTKTDPNKPFDTYSRPKYVFTMQDIERSNRERREAGNKIGKLPVNNDTREDILADANSDLKARITRGELQPVDKNGEATRAVLASNPPPSDDDEFIAIDAWLAFSRSLEQVRNSYYVS